MLFSKKESESDNFVLVIIAWPHKIFWFLVVSKLCLSKQTQQQLIIIIRSLFFWVDLRKKCINKKSASILMQRLEGGTCQGWPCPGELWEGQRNPGGRLSSHVGWNYSGSWCLGVQPNPLAFSWADRCLAQGVTCPGWPEGRVKICHFSFHLPYFMKSSLQLFLIVKNIWWQKLELKLSESR